MIITYNGHSSFKLKARQGTLVTDPFDEYVGFSFPTSSADVVTVSHQHPDHNAVKNVSGTARRQKPFVIDALGEYEVEGISVFGTKTYHDSHQGVERGANFIYTIYMEDLRLCHLGDLGHAVTEELVSEIGLVDILFVPVGGVFTIDPKQAVEVIKAFEPSLVIPMHYRTPQHKPEVFGEMKTLEDFLQEYGVEVQPVDKLVVERGRLPEETEVVVLERNVTGK